MCYEETKTPLTCTCGCIACPSCQKRSESPKCMGCSLVLSSQALGNKLSKALLRPWEEEQFWKREESLLPNTQLLLDWETEMDRLKAQQRFGFKPVLPPKPRLVISGSSPMFPCPLQECRGFIGDGTCGTCKAVVCTQCREIHEGACNQSTLDSLQAIQLDSRACPNCTVLIYKTLGCDHMFCTHCRVHWHWETRKILKESSNGHYNQTPTFANAAILQSRAVDTNCTENFLHALPETFRPGASPWALALHNALVVERKQVIFAYQTLYNAARLRRKHEEHLVQLRLKFLRKEFDLSEIKARIWKAEKSLEKNQSISQLLYIYLEQTHRLHRLANLVVGNTQDCVKHFNDIQLFCNEQAQALKREHGGNVPTFVELSLEVKPLILF